MTVGQMMWVKDPRVASTCHKEKSTLKDVLHHIILHLKGTIINRMHRRKKKLKDGLFIQDPFRYLTLSSRFDFDLQNQVFCKSS